MTLLGRDTSAAVNGAWAAAGSCSPSLLFRMNTLGSMWPDGAEQVMDWGGGDPTERTL